MRARRSFDKLLRELDGGGRRHANIIGCAPKPPGVGLSGIGFRKSQMNRGIAGGVEIAEWRGRIGVEGESGFAAEFDERVLRLLGIKFGNGDEGVTVKDGSVQNLYGGLDGIVACGGGDFATNARADGLQIFAAGGTVAIEKIEGYLGIEDGLPGGLEGEELRGLRLEFFDAGTAGFGNGPEKDQGETTQADAAEGVEELRCGEPRSGGNSVKSLVFVGAVTRTVDGEPHLHTRDVQRGARQIDDDGSGFAGGGEIALREGFRAGEKYKLCARETAFLDGLDDRRFATSFGESTGGDFFIEQGKIPSGEAAFFEQRFEFGAEQGRRAGDYHALGVPRCGH